ncbi:cellulose biosynthesis protein BcsD [Glacieibacterium sp.]|uniref:cellulose biosynthesis protein BcsD n=1 Tax=Glacieibacterium sp. TaxID=2860237 RepID=UPI003AFF7697
MSLAMIRSGANDLDAWGGRPSALESLLTEEIFAQATEEQGLSFFAAVGARIAARHHLPENAGLVELEVAINHVWQELGLGRVALTMAPDGIAIDHQGGTGGGAARSEEWPRAAASMLQGAYAAWFQAIGGATLSTRLVKQTKDRIVLHHGL